jgi:hypothetical protein
MMTNKPGARKQPRTKEPVRLGIPPNVRNASAQASGSKDRTKASTDKPRRIKEPPKAKTVSGHSSK